MSNPDVSLAEFSGGSYEPWLFQTMIDELASNELGIGFIYLVLEILAKRYALNDAVVVLEHESLTTQEFRLGGAAMDSADTIAPTAPPIDDQLAGVRDEAPSAYRELVSEYFKSLSAAP